ncbi:HD-GYP domain-containing protein [Sporomusa acidovorans]|uniref:Cyclic di-GMP phosphodiesterase n=1 Tax=Sporomusa acidovorans (strain ATCC 49682 / DSM 3132 / Mol) TaxID=1123286 RepID=A0ABZ3J0B2_SPOA4|nr:HD domain-containing phosphohydrolase [Sporomusa acidovorans]OZC22815.1 cyclic di-GMP phosphodiesterase response regulator RpfG [Sporomusa acidovorans DSM 3132]SDE51773.1 HD-GYP domain, c-di-GMP phosphodiesterase class II (or its inactivated variant) [Sporomusa acidovorans]
MSDNYQIARYPISQLRPGLKLGETVLSPDGGVLLYAGTMLTHKHIERLIFYKIDHVRIREFQTGEADTLGQQGADPVEQEALIAHHEYCEPDMPATVSEQENEFANTYGNAVKDLKKCFTIVRLEKHLDCDLLHSIVDSLLTLTPYGIGATALLHTANRSEDYLFHHSVNVGILAHIIGTLSGAFKPSQQKNLILAGILHDIGKLEIPVHVLYKKGRLDEDELHMVRQHPAIAYKFFRHFKEVPENVRLGVLQHHERDDGSGYPLHTNGAKNHPIAKVLGIADVYDAMTSKKVYGQEVSPFAAIDTLQTDTFSGKFSPNYTTPFLHELCQTLIGRYVTLNDGNIGQLVFWNRSGKETCLIRFSDGQVIDISNQNKLKIMKLVC